MTHFTHVVLLTQIYNINEDAFKYISCYKRKRFHNITYSHCNTFFQLSISLFFQPYYASRPTLPANSGRVQSSPAPHPIPPQHGARPAHVFQSGPSQMMMIPQQSISFPNTQGTAFYIPGQVRVSCSYKSFKNQFTHPPTKILFRHLLLFLNYIHIINICQRVFHTRT